MGGITIGWMTGSGSGSGIVGIVTTGCAAGSYAGADCASTGDGCGSWLTKLSGTTGSGVAWAADIKGALVAMISTRVPQFGQNTPSLGIGVAQFGQFIVPPP
jgi:hypothetical protein